MCRIDYKRRMCLESCTGGGLVSRIFHRKSSCLESSTGGVCMSNFVQEDLVPRILNRRDFF